MIKSIVRLFQNKMLDETSAISLIAKVKKIISTDWTDSTSQLFKDGEPFTEGHKVFGKRILLGVTHISLVIDAFRKIFPVDVPISIGKIFFIEPIILRDSEIVAILPRFKNTEEEVHFSNSFAVVTDNQTDLKNISFVKKGSTSVLSFHLDEENLDTVNIEYYINECIDQVKGSEIYNNLNEIEYSPSLQTIHHVYHGKDYSLAKLKISEEILSLDTKYYLHPALIDGAILATLCSLIRHSKQETYIPLFIKNVIVYRQINDTCWCLGSITKNTSELITCNFSLIDSQGNICAVFNEVSCKRVKDLSIILENETINHSPKSKENIDKNINLSEVKIMNLDNMYELIVEYMINKIASHLVENVEIDLEKNYMDLGLESSSLIKIASEIESEIGIELYPTLFFEYQCTKDVSSYFYKEFNLEFKKYLSKTSVTATNKFNKLEQIDTKNFHDKKLNSEKLTKSNNKEINQQQPLYTGDIAIIGMAGVFPDSSNTEEFWNALYSRKNLIKEIPSDHFDYKPWFDSSGKRADSMYCKWGSFIDEVDKFDAEFFNMLPREAELTDPQLRHLLQVIYTTIDDAGYMNKIRGSDTGMYVGACFHDYQTQMVSERKSIEPYDGIGNSPTMLSNRPSFYFDLKGPSFTLDTACSSSLVALHLACKALQNGECSMAFAAGVNLLLTPGHYLYFCNIGALSKSGRSHSFDDRADGYIPGEGIASVLLKPLGKALEDNDQIHGVIKGSAVRHSGYSSTITAPNVQGEADVITSAWKDSGIDPTTISYIEAHGTGTKIGDPIEIQALQKAMSNFSFAPASCAIGSAKAHIGHLEGAAGIAGVIKVIVSMKNKIIPAMPAFKNLNPFIKMPADGALYINNEAIKWNVNGSPLRAGINSFGFGGTFSHVVLEEAPSAENRPHNIKDTSPKLILLSAKTAADLKNKAIDLLDYFNKKDYINDTNTLSDIAYTLQVKRKHFNVRVGFAVENMTQLIDELNLFISNGKKDIISGTESYEHNKEIIKVFENDNNLKSSLKHYVSGNYSPKNLLTLWTKGFDFEWNLLYTGVNKRPISLPSYPFNKKSFWYKDRSATKIDLTNVLAKINLNEDSNYTDNLLKFTDGFSVLELLCKSLLINTLIKTGFYDKLCEANSIEKLKVLSSIDNKFDKLLDQIIYISEQENVLKYAEGVFKIDNIAKRKHNAIDSKINKFKNKYPELESFIDLAQLMLGSLQDILNSRIKATEILFSIKGASLLNQIYNNNIIADFFNKKIGTFLEYYLNINDKKNIVILEIGAGLGGTTDKILPIIANYSNVTQYIYSDNSEVFHTQAKKFKAQFPLVEFKLINIEKNAQDQGMSDIKADIIICSNVLHATSNINTTLRNIKTFLNDDGILIINEITSYQHFLTVTFGLIDGWWLFKDEANRISGSPLLSVENWIKVLRESNYNFHQVIHQEFNGQHIIIAREAVDNTNAFATLSTPKALNSIAPLIIEPTSEYTDENTISIHESLEYKNDFTIIIKQIIVDMTQRPEVQISADKNFLDIGIDSITGIEFLEKLNTVFNKKIEMPVLFNNPSVNLLSQYISENNIQIKSIEIDDRYNRYNADENLYISLKKEKNLLGKMSIYDLFKDDGLKRTTTQQALDVVYSDEIVRVERIKLNAGNEMEIIRTGKSGPILVLLSPLNSLATIWQNQVNSLGQEYQIIIPHYPGFGDSDMIEDDFSIEDLGSLIIEMLDKLQLNQPYNMVGWSMGGLIAQSMAERHAEKIKTVTLLGTGTISMFDDNYHNEHTHVKLAIRDEIENGCENNTEVLENENLLIATFNTSILTHYATIIRDFDHKLFRNIIPEVLIVNGSEDKILDPKYAKALVNNFPVSQYKEINGGGHFVALTHPSIFNNILAEFILASKLDTNLTFTV